jgi:hypothetical protein
MTTHLKKAVKRRTNETRRDKGKHRAIIIIVYPAGFIGFRLQGTRTEERIPIQAAYERAIKMRLAFEKAEKARKRKEKREGKS